MKDLYNRVMFNKFYDIFQLFKYHHNNSNDIKQLYLIGVINEQINKTL